MTPLNLEEVDTFVNNNISNFHDRRISILSNLTIKSLLSKNPYLFRAKNISTAGELVESTMTAFLSSSEEKLFGGFLEELAVFVAGKTKNGRKSSSQGIDLEFTDDQVHYIVSIKSGQNWGNSSQHKKLAQDFKSAQIRLKQSRHTSEVRAVLGICYGKAKTTIASENYYKIVGQNFWALISGDRDLYKNIIEPVGYRAKEHNERYEKERCRIVNLLTRQFIERYCDASGNIDWQKIVEANSGNYDLDKMQL